MRGKAQLFFLVIGMLIYILDLTSDIWIAIQYYRNNESKWFAPTLSFIIITIVITNVAACLHASKDSIEGPCKWLWVFCACCPILSRYMEELTYWKRANLDSSLCGEACQKSTCRECENLLEKKRKLAKSIYSLAWLHLIQALTESAPQFCLQLFIMLEQWDFPCFTVLSTSVSLLSLAWCITALEQARETKNNNPSLAFAFLAWQFFALASRLSAIVIFAYVFQYHVFSILAFHWFVVTIAIAIHRKDEFKGEGVGPWIFMLSASCCCVYPLLVFASEPLLAFCKNRRFYTFIISIILAVENMIMLALTIGITKYGRRKISMADTDVLLPVALACVLGGIALETVFCVAYYKCCCRKDTDVSKDRQKIDDESPGNRVSTVEINAGFNRN
ncbi:XK-related 6 [Paramuricea clavata]|uniref:XK-related protein n=1 Tax=Paramuricea clavata TaxID=317549 RepID=A0A6S7LTZ5_PARCT|nr:XK-related 6 [Paramuricea clavata]